VQGNDFEAMNLYIAIGSLPDEAEARVRAAKALHRAGRGDEATAVLRPALDFYRSVEAAGLLLKAETLVTAP
jgi:Flp pilus assembly protein TadD